MEAPQDNLTEKPADLYVQKDVLGLEKPITTSTTNAKPNRIFIALAIIVVLALAYWLITGR